MNDRIAKTLAARRSYLESKEKGFTLVELLVVVLIIGILAAIAIPMFLSQRQGAWEAQVKSDLANAVIAAETLAVKNNGSYSTITLDTLKANGFNPTTGVTISPLASAVVTASAAGVTPVVIGAAAGQTYTISAVSSSYVNKTWTYASTTGVTSVTP